MTTRDKLQFALEMGRRTRASVRQVEALLRYAGALEKLEYQRRNQTMSYGDTVAASTKRERIQRKVTELCGEIEAPEYMQVAVMLYQALMNATPVGVRSAEKRMAAVFLKDKAPVTYIETCIPVFDGPALKIRTPEGGEIVCPS